MTKSRMKEVAREMVHSVTGIVTRNDQQVVEEYRNMYNDLLSMVIEQQEENERIHKKAMELLPIPIDEDTEAEMKKCREACESISGRVAGVWKDDGLDVNAIRMKLLMIEWILDTPEFGLGAGENLLDLAYAMAKERVLQLEHDEPYAKEEAAE
ncbi:MAG: hypothetical protein SOW08_05650 [Lachnospiraceae bacterium]|nr:hypothetical protein [Lachnospiraceae bacterium]